MIIIIIIAIVQIIAMMNEHEWVMYGNDSLNSY